MKRIVAVFLSIVVLLATFSTASAADKETDIQYLEDGSYFVTTIEKETTDIAPFSTTTTKSKISTYYSASGTALWYVKVTGTFTYGGGTSKCTSSSVTAGSYSSNWVIVSKSASRSGNTATATAVVNQLADGVVVNTVTKKVTLTCSATGDFS